MWKFRSELSTGVIKKKKNPFGVVRGVFEVTFPRKRGKRDRWMQKLFPPKCAALNGHSRIYRGERKKIFRNTRTAISAVFQNAVYMIGELPQFIPRSCRARDLNATRPCWMQSSCKSGKSLIAKWSTTTSANDNNLFRIQRPIIYRVLRISNCTLYIPVERSALQPQLIDI